MVELLSAVEVGGVRDMGEISFVCVFDTDRRNQRWDLCGCGSMCGEGPRASYVPIYSIGCTSYHPPSSHFVSIHSLPSTSVPLDFQFPCFKPILALSNLSISMQYFSY